MSEPASNVGVAAPEEGVANPSGENILPGRLRRFAPLFAACVAGVALVGYLRGITEFRPLPQPEVGSPADGETGGVPAAVGYDELPKARIQPNAGWESQLAALKYERPGYLDPVTRTEEMKLAALADRSANRAFDTAPPTVPHPIDQRSDASCLACHGQGVKIGDRVATRMSHSQLNNCTQCHVESVRSGLPWKTEPVENGFAGVSRAGAGTRAYPGAPPTVPHVTWMREDCMSCHGLVARPGLRTTHPYLASCTQCHVPSAQADQVDFLREGK